ncbi:MAG: hypothetical protein CM1200mP24_09620 [Gammaproteobacteria bacterium]|nr:MAG: hypothetical protein CM1200mP24_09620 [Gammaproteobacteria bacterium]
MSSLIWIVGDYRVGGEGTGMVRQALAGLKNGQVSFEYSPESFTGTELDFAVEICEAVVAEWGGTKENQYY